MVIKALIVEYVLPFLPAKSLIRFRSVSQEWDYWIKSPILAHRQSYSFRQISGFFYQCNEGDPDFLTLSRPAYGVPTPHLTFLPNPLNIISSCNGLLLCQARNGNNSYFICSPATKSWRELPQPGYYHGPEPAIVLAFEPSLLNVGPHYHLICAVHLLTEPIVFFEIYSSETNSWRCSDTICVELGNVVRFTNNVLYAKGVAYWETSTGQVLAFDLKTELHGIIPLPLEEIQRNGVLGVIHDELCYICISNGLNDDYKMYIYGGVELKCRRVLDLRIENVSKWIEVHKVVAFVSDDQVMILVGDVIYKCRLSDGRLEVISSVGAGATRLLPYVNSLVSVA